MSVVKALELAYVRIQVPDLDAAERFFNTHWTDRDMLDASVETGVTELAEMHASWGPDMPDGFIAQGGR